MGEIKMSERITMTAEEVARLIGLHIDTVYDMARKKEIPCIRIRRRVFFRREAIERWMAEKEGVKE